MYYYSYSLSLYSTLSDLEIEQLLISNGDDDKKRRRDETIELFELLEKENIDLVTYIPRVNSILIRYVLAIYSSSRKKIFLPLYTTMDSILNR